GARSGGASGCWRPVATRRTRASSWGSLAASACGRSTAPRDEAQRRPVGPRARDVLEAADGERAPALVARPEPAARVAVEVLVEDGHAPPARIRGEPRVGARTGPPPARVREEEAAEAGRELARDLAQVHELPRAGRALDPQAVAVEVVVALERLHDEVVQREPHGPAPVRVAPEERAGRLAGRVGDAVLRAVGAEHVRAVAVDARHGAEAVRPE